MESEENASFFKVTKFQAGEQDPEKEQARETIAHDQFLNPKPEFLAKLERHKALFTLNMSIQRINEAD